MYFLVSIVFYLLAFIGSFVVSKHIVSLLNVYKRLLMPYRLRPIKDPWAVITGASEGIGKEYALQFAERGYNLVLIARTKSKLDEVALLAEKFKIQVRVVPLDLASRDLSSLAPIFDQLDIQVLVNNAAISHDIPTPFIDESFDVIDKMLTVNIRSVLYITRLVLNQMKKRENGLVINCGSFSGMAPCPYLSVYGPSKAFVRSWSIALGIEMEPHGVHVEYTNTYFVATAMSKIRKKSWLIPSASDYVKSVMSSYGHHFERVPHASHALYEWVIRSFVSESYVSTTFGDHLLKTRKRALKKRDEIAKAD